MSDTLRLFVALELPQTALDALVEAQDQLRNQLSPRVVRWVRPAGIHLTLKFLGETPAQQRDAIAGALGKAVTGHAPLSLSADGLGCFPNPSRPRVVWIGLGGDLATLAALQESVEAALAGQGFKREKRKFNPHLTLGRVRREAKRDAVRALGDLIEATTIGEIATWTADSLSLMRSELRPDGARYTCLANFEL